MVLVDTCGWIEWLIEGKLYNAFAKYLNTPEEIIVPAIVQFELYRWVCRERDETIALNVVGVTERGNVLSIDTHLALTAADFAAQYKLAMADAMVYACAQLHHASLVTCDHHFQKLPGVIYFP